MIQAMVQERAMDGTSDGKRGAMDQERAMVKYKGLIREGAIDGTCDRSGSNG